MSQQYPRHQLAKPKILISYHYLKKNKHYRRFAHKIAPHCQILLDCGAYSDFAKWQKALAEGKKYEKTDLGEYIEYLDEFGHLFWRYIQLDVIGDTEKSAKNLKIMLKNGLKPMPVLLIGEKVEKMREISEISDWVCIAGGVTASDDWIRARLRDAWKAGDGKAHLHCLGFGRWPDILLIEYLQGGDSVTAFTGAIFGYMSYYSKSSGIVQIQRRAIFKKTVSAQLRMLGKLGSYGITLKMLKDPEMYKKMYGIPSMTMTNTFLNFAQHCHERKKNYFITCASIAHVLQLAGTIAGYDEGRWHYPTARKSYMDYLTRWKNHDEREQVTDDVIELFKEKTR
jgi:hypothetical protein